MIGERLLNLRKEAGLTQDELGHILKINKHSISAYEREKSEPPDEIKIAIAQHFNVSIDYLLGLTDNPAPHNTPYTAVYLPLYLPDSAKRSLKDFADYLIYKYQEKNSSSP